MELLFLLLNILILLLIIECKKDSNIKIKKINKKLKKLKSENKILFNYIESIYEDIERLDIYEEKKECE